MTSSAATFSDIEQVFEFSFNNKYTWKHNKNTHKSMKNCRNHVYKHLGNRFPIEKTDQGAMDYLYDLMVEQDASNTLFNRCKTALQTALNFSVSRKKIFTDIREPHINSQGMFHFESKPENRVPQPVIQKEEAERMITAAQNHFGGNLADAIAISVYSGMGYDEWTQLQACDIHWGDVPFIWVGNRPDFTLKRDVRKRKIPLVGELTGRKLIPIIKKRYEDAKGTSIPLFGDDWTNADQHRREFNKVKNFCNINPHVTPYCLRHSFCTWLIQADVALPKVQRLMGHAQITTTMNYIHVADNDLANAIERL